MILLARRPIDQLVRTGKVTLWLPDSRAVLEPGVTHSIKASRDHEAITRALVKDDPAERILHRITFEEALNAGFKNREEFWTWTRRAYDLGPVLGDVSDEVQELLAKRMLVYELQLVAGEAPRGFLARGRGETSSLARALMTPVEDQSTGTFVLVPEEPVDRTTQRRYSREGQDRDTSRERRRREAWEQKTLAERVAALEALENGEVWRQLAAIRDRVEAAERKLRRDAA